MVITTATMQSQLRAIFPGIVDWLPTDRDYLLADIETVRSLITKYRDPLNRYIPQVWECEEIASAFMVDVRRGELAAGKKKNMAIGEALGTKWNGVEKRHHANIFFSADGIYLFDMVTQKIWQAKPGQDKIFFVRI